MRRRSISPRRRVSKRLTDYETPLPRPLRAGTGTGLRDLPLTKSFLIADDPPTHGAREVSRASARAGLSTLEK